MSDLYTIINKVINEPDKTNASNILYGLQGIHVDSAAYYQKIIANFIRKKDTVLPKINGQVEFDLDKDIKEIWDIVFIAQYVIDFWECKIRDNDINKNFYNDCLQKLRKIQVEIKGVSSLESVPETVIDDLKKSIVIFQKLRDSIEHPSDNFELGEQIKIDNEKGYFKVNIPIDYIDGFNKGRIIAKKENEVLIERTNNICFPILESCDYDPKKLESFFYNVDPDQLSFLLDICDNKTENLYRLPAYLFSKTKNFNKLLRSLLKLNDSKVLCESDFVLLNKISYDLKNDYTDNLICLLYNSKKNPIISMDDVVLLSRVFTQNELNVSKSSENLERGNIIINNYYFIKEIIENCNHDKLKLNELPYDLFALRDRSLISKYINVILEIKGKIFEENNELSETLNYWFNSFIENGNLYQYLNMIKDIFDNAYIYAPTQNKYEYIIDLLLIVISTQNWRINPRKPWMYLPLEDEDKSQIESTFEEFKHNHKIQNKIRKLSKNSKPRSVRRNTNNEKVINLLKKIKERKITFNEFWSELRSQNEIDMYYLIGFNKIRWYEEELNYLLLKTNNDYELSVEVINRLSDNVRDNTLNDDGVSFNADYQQNYNGKIKNNFRRNVDVLLSKFEPGKLLEYPPEFLYSDEAVFNHLYENYNSNLCKSIFGIANPKIIGTLIYINSVLSHFNKNLMNISINPYDIIHCSFNDTIKYSDNMPEEIRITSQEKYLRQFLYNDKDNTIRNDVELNEFIITKLRNASAHFRFKIIKDEVGNIIEDKIYLYDEYNDGTNNFNIIIDIKILVEIIRQIEIEMSRTNAGESRSR